MKKVMVVGLILFSAVLLINNSALASNELAKMVVVLDSGHGGFDPGASARFGKGKRVTESAYCFDVLLRLERMLKKKGAKVIKTTKNDSWTTPIANHPSQELPSNNEAVLTWDGSPVRAGSRAITKRVKMANSALKIPDMQRVNFISVHFDSLPDEKLEGTRVIAGKEAYDFSALLAKELGAEHRTINNGDPVVENDDKKHGIKRIHVLGSTNRIRQKVLIELGNFNNQRDLWKIRDYRIRENYAQIITRALIKLNAQPVKR